MALLQPRTNTKIDDLNFQIVFNKEDLLEGEETFNVSFSSDTFDAWEIISPTETDWEVRPDDWHDYQFYHLNQIIHLGKGFMHTFKPGNTQELTLNVKKIILKEK
jgi:hypothetical protein